MEPNPGELKARAQQMRQQQWEQWHTFYIIANGPRLPGTMPDIAHAEAKMAELEQIIRHIDETYLKENQK